MSKSHNRCDFKKSFKDFNDNRLSFSVSTRSIRSDMDIMDYLKIFYMYCDPGQIESVFGSTERFSRLYGGRLNQVRYRLTTCHLARLAENNIHLSLTLTNHFFDEAAYRESWVLLEEHHKKGNSIICTNDRLAVRLRQDFPLYELKASIIKNIDSPGKIKRALEIYDSLTLPMDKNDDDDFLNSIQEKQRIILFGNAACAYTCPARTCYLGFSQEISGKPVTSGCSKGETDRLDVGQVFFDVKKLADMGYSRFKLVPLAPKGSIEVCREISQKKGYPIDLIKRYKEIYYLCSYNKCGRTWLRFIMTNYLNLKYNLGLVIDLHSFFSLFPNDDCDPLKGMVTYRYPADRRFPLILSSHAMHTAEKFGGIPLARIVFLMRSIPDVVVSDYFQVTRELKSYTGELKTFIRDAGGGLARYCRYLNAWAPVVQTGQVLTLTYEMLHRNTEETMANFLTFLEIPVDTEKLREAVALSSFDVMQAIEKEGGLPRYQAASDDPEAPRVRKGTVGGSSDYLDQDDRDFIHRTAGSILNASAKTLLQQHHLWEG